MTKSRNIGRGGARPGSGPKKKPTAAACSGAEVSPLFTPAMTQEQIDELIERLAVEALATITATGASEAARVAAAKYLLDRKRGKPFTAKQPDERQLELDDGWDELLSLRSSAGRSN